MHQGGEVTHGLCDVPKGNFASLFILFMKKAANLVLDLLFLWLENDSK